jgi:hypothetical protein
MTRRTWFAGKDAAAGGNPFYQSLLRLVGRARAAAPADKSGERSAPNSSAEPSWTAALHRGGDLPPFRVSILTADDFHAPMRMEPCRRESASSRPAEM